MSLLRGIVNENKKTLVDSLYLIGMQGINQLLPLVIMPYLLYILGGEGYGFVGFSFSVVQYMILVVDFGFNFSATKKIAQCLGDQEAINSIFWSVVWAKSLLLLGMLCLLFGMFLFVPTFQYYSLAILATLPMVIGATFTFIWMFQGIGKVRDMAIINTVSKLIMLPLIFLFVKEQDDYFWAALVQSLVFMLTAIVSNIYLYKYHLLRKPSFSWNSIKCEFRDSFPLFVSNASTSVYTQMFVVVLGFFTTVGVVGKYAAADRIMRSLCNGIFVPIYQAFFPKISQLAKQNIEAAKKLLQQVGLIVLISMCLICAVLLTTAGWVECLLGGDYVGIGQLLRILSITPIFISVGGVCGLMGLIAIGAENSKIHFRNVYVGAAIFALILVFILIPKYHDVGASIALLSTEIMVGVFMFIYYKKDIKK